MSILGVIYRNWKQQGRNETNYFMYQWVGPVCSPPYSSSSSNSYISTKPVYNTSSAT